MVSEPLPPALSADAHQRARKDPVSPSADAAGFHRYGSRLDHVDLSLRLSREEEETRLAAAERRLLHLRLGLGGLTGDGTLGPPVCVVFEGWDASGKGGAIKRLVGRLDPRHVRVAQFAAPTHDEKRHHFLARFYAQLPGWGGMAVFDRSWYGRVLVERVDGYASADQWRRGYDEIVQFERSLALEGTVLVKLWLHISAAEQLRRFESRRDDPLKSWKLTKEDWHNRAKRTEYEAAVEEMLERTDHHLAPWDLVAAENKRYARVKVIHTVIARIEEGMRRHGMEPPPPKGADFDPVT
jgi:polyphosphate kinase 2 (PPK2 family)